MTHRDSRMSFQRATSRDRLVVNVGVVDGAITIDGYRRISAFGLRDAIGHDKLTPGDTAIGAESAALLATALVDR